LKRGALFLDRDGVINFDRGYVHRKEDFEFIPGIFEVVRFANKAGLRVVVVTNQSGIARGLYSESTFHSLSQWMLGQFECRGATVDAVYHCPHHPDYVYNNVRGQCTCRKPEPGMFLRAIEELRIDPDRSVVIGDNISDMQAGERAGLGELVLLRGQCNEDVELGPMRSHVRVIDSLFTLLS
jgi:D-glycero-D-manno-heptose 1,7-bisphosphate phosphatase